MLSADLNRYTPTKAVIQLSLRHKTDDHLWFSFFHEAGHVLLHSKKETFITGDPSADAACCRPD